MRWLITGSGGLLAPYLRDAAAAEGEAVTSGRRGGDYPCDLADIEAVARLIAEVRPDAVVHAAGLTDVDGCERDPDAAMTANSATVASLVAALPADVRLTYVSTDQVYPMTPGPHREDGAAPVNMYGRSKLAGEAAALAHPGALVLRTNFFGPARATGKQSLSDFFVTSLAEGRPVTLFEDVFFSPLHMKTLSHILVEASLRRAAGVFNAGSNHGFSKAEFGLSVARQKGLSTDSARVGSSESVAGRAPRPKDLRVDVSRLETALGRRMPSLQDEIEKL